MNAKKNLVFPEITWKPPCTPNWCFDVVGKRSRESPPTITQISNYYQPPYYDWWHCTSHFLSSLGFKSNRRKIIGKGGLRKQPQRAPADSQALVRAFQCIARSCCWLSRPL